MSDKSNNRNASMDLLRVIACIMVVLVHVNVSWKYLSIDSLQFKTAIIYDCFCRGAVLIFFMLSGAFGRSTDIKKGVKKAVHFTVIFILISMFYSISDAILGLTEGSSITIDGLLDGFFSYKYHLWFLPSFIFLLFVSPFINRLFNSDKGRIVIWCYLVIWIIFGVLLKTVQVATDGVAGLNMIDRVVSGMKFSTVLSQSPIGCYCLGRLFAEKKRSAKGNWSLFILALAASIIIGALTFSYSHKMGSFDYRWMNDTTILILMQAIGWFCFASTITVSGKSVALIEKIAPTTFGIYLIHPFFIDWLTRIKIFGEVDFCGIYIIPAIQALLRLAVVLFLCYFSVIIFTNIRKRIFK